MKYARTTVPRQAWPEKKDEYQMFRADPNQPVDFDQKEEEKGHNFVANPPQEQKPPAQEPEEQTKPPVEETKPAVPEAKPEQQKPSQDSQNTSNPSYKPSQTVQDAWNMLEQMKDQQPGAYESRWQAQLDSLMAELMGRDKFSYDLNADALYKQVAEQYARMGQMAMMDTMGQAQAMTGGYGNSWAQNAGQQAYQGYMQQLNQVVPELYGMAYDRYQQEGQDLMNRYGLIASQEEQDYGRYRDSVADYYDRLDRATEEARYQEQMDYEKWMAENATSKSAQEAAVEYRQMKVEDREYWNNAWGELAEITDKDQVERKAELLVEQMIAEGYSPELAMLFLDYWIGPLFKDQVPTDVPNKNYVDSSNGGPKDPFKRIAFGP